ncbi:MAG: TVP38/TMEM64 family protein [Rhodospirillales bacterium]|nr:TVP38/TMEM64 family protein [Rhodospirillales bacterium]
MEAPLNDPKRPAVRHYSFRRLAPLGLIGIGFALFFLLGFDSFLTFETLSEHRKKVMEWTDANYALAVVGFIFTYYVAVMFSLPGAVWMTLAGGFLFGGIEATVYVVVGATLGAVAIFLAARYAFGEYFRAKAGSSLEKMREGFQENALSYLLVLRLIPLFPFWLVNLVPAFLGVPLLTYTIGTFVGIIPGTFIYASVGNGLGAVFEAGNKPDLTMVFKPEILAPIFGLAALSLVPVVYKKLRKRVV